MERPAWYLVANRFMGVELSACSSYTSVRKGNGKASMVPSVLPVETTFVGHHTFKLCQPLGARERKKKKEKDS